MSDNFVVLETSSFSQNVARLRAKLQREKTTHRVEIDVAIEINKLRVEIKRLQTKRDISIVQQHVMKKKSFEKRRFFLHHDNEFQFMLFAKMFSIVNRKHFAKIFRCIFMSKQLHKLVNDYSIKNVLRIEIENDLFDFDIKGMSHLTRCLSGFESLDPTWIQLRILGSNLDPTKAVTCSYPSLPLCLKILTQSLNHLFVDGID